MRLHAALSMLLLGDATALRASCVMSAAADRRPGKPYTFLTIQPKFTVQDWDSAQLILEQMVDQSRSEMGCAYYGFTRCAAENSLFCSEAYEDADAVLTHIRQISPLAEKLTAPGIATLDQVSLHGPESELAKVKAGLDAERAARWQFYVIDSGVSYFTKQTGAIMKSQTMLSIKPTFTVSDWSKAKPIMDEFVRRTQAEPGCIYYGWTIDRSAGKLFCREAYFNADDVLSHLENVGSLVEELVADGVATLDRIELHGPRMQLERCKVAMDPFGTAYYNLEMGFQKFEAWAGWEGWRSNVRF